MDRPWYFSGAEVQRHACWSLFVDGVGALVLLLLITVPAFPAQVPLRDGQPVTLKLRNVLTTDNCRKGDTIEFEVGEAVLVTGHVLIAKGALAQGRVVDVKGAFRPRDTSAEVVFRFLTVRAADQQELPLRLRPGKIGKVKEDEVHEKTIIPGQITRVVGADKGKEYSVYVDGAFTIATTDIVGVSREVAAAPPVAPEPDATAALPSAPATPPAAAVDVAEPSSVEVDSSPDGADILVDGNPLGKTHTTLHLLPGRHDIEIRMAGYRTWSRRMVVDPESLQTVRATLTPQ